MVVGSPVKSQSNRRENTGYVVVFMGRSHTVEDLTNSIDKMSGNIIEKNHYECLNNLKQAVYGLPEAY